MNRFENKQSGCRWRRYSHKPFAAFQSLHKEISIGMLGVAMLSSCTFAKQPPSAAAELQKGDLLFCLGAEGGTGLDGAIAAVTEGIGSKSITHVAIVLDQARVLEATPQAGVRVINLAEFLSSAEHSPDGVPLVLAGRLNDTTGVALSVERAMNYIGRPYDFLYQTDDSAIYCSELVQLSYQRPGGIAIFEQEPMSFCDTSGQIAPYWQQLYEQYGMEVPEGLPGTNPGAMSRSGEITISNLSFP